MSYVVTTGTTTKNQVFTTLVNAMVAAGWTNVSSNATTDFTVLNSTGSSGNQNLYIQLRSSDDAHGTSAYDTTTTDYNIMSYRMVSGYTPGTSGAAGTFAWSGEAWYPLNLTALALGTTTPGATSVNYKIFANKNFAMISLEYPPAVSAGTVFFWIGLPDVTYCSEPNSRGVLVATTTAARYSNAFHINDNSGEIASNNASISNPFYCQLSAKNPNAAGEYMISDIYYGSGTEGIRGKLTGVYALPNQNVLNGDTITIGTSSYYVLLCGVYSNNAFPSSVLCVQTA